MSSKINASTSGVGGLVSSADNSGILELQSAGATKFTVSQEGAYGTLRLESAKNATGTAVDFTGIPSWVKRITVMFAGVSTNGTSPVQVQLGTLSGGVENTLYASGGTNQVAGSTSGSTSTTGLIVGGNSAATHVRSGNGTINLVSGTTWNFAYIGTTEGAESSISGGRKVLPSSLDRIRITTVNGTDTFDAGIINLLLEG